MISKIASGLKVVPTRHVWVFAENQFLLNTKTEVQNSINQVAGSLRKKGILFVDAKEGQEVDYANLPPHCPVLVYQPNLSGKQMIEASEKMRGFVDKSAIVVAAKGVPQDAKFDINIRQGAGVNNYPDDGRPVQNLPGLNSRITAENTLKAIAGDDYLQKASQMAYDGKVSSGNLEPLYGKRPEVDMNKLNAAVRGKTIAIIGAGNVGTTVLRTLLQTDARRVVAHSRSLAGHNQRAKQVLGSKIRVSDNLHEALAGADILVNHLALVAGPDGTTNYITQGDLEKMNPNAIIVDASRAGIIDPDALKWATESRRFARITADFDTPDVQPLNEDLYNFAKKHPDLFNYVPHAFADTDPVTRQNMFSAAITLIEDAQKGQFYNLAKGSLPEGAQNMGRRVPEDICSLLNFIQAREPNTVACNNIGRSAR